MTARRICDLKLYLNTEESAKLDALAARYGTSRNEVLRNLLIAEYDSMLSVDVIAPRIAIPFAGTFLVTASQARAIKDQVSLCNQNMMRS